MRFAVVGTGFGAIHLEWLSSCPGLTVEVLCYERNRARAVDLSEKFRIARTSDDPFTVIKSGLVDAIAVVTPPNHHPALLEAGIAAGLTVVCDKPLALDAVTAHRLAAQARDAGVRSLVTFQWRTNPALQRLRDLVVRSELGPVFRADLEFHHDFLAGGATDWPWRHRRATAGSGALADQGVHLFDLLAWLLPGQWSAVATRTAVRWPRRTAGDVTVDCETDDTAEAWLARREDAIQARVLVSRVSAGYRSVRISVHADGGSAWVTADPDDGRARLVVHRAGASEPQTAQFPPAAMNPYTLLDGSAAADPALPTFDAGAAAQSILDDVLAKAERSSADPRLATV